MASLVGVAVVVEAMLPVVVEAALELTEDATKDERDVPTAADDTDVPAAADDADDPEGFPGYGAAGSLE